jgi:hypothetical protein
LKDSNPKLYNLQAAAHAREVASENKIIAEFAAVKDTSTYDVDAHVFGLDAPKDKPYDIGTRGMSVDKNGYTYGDPDQVFHHNIVPRGPSFRFVWVRPTGQIGIGGLGSNRKNAYDPLNVETLHVGANKAFEMVSPTSPPGAFDQLTPPPWPKPNPPPKSSAPGGGPPLPQS